MFYTDIITESKKAEEWLSNYTLQNLDKWPSDSIIAYLLKKYPLDTPKTVYRGLNFETQEAYQAFMSKFDSQGRATLEFAGISSWSPSEQTANQFAVTRPTYYVDWAIIMADRQREKEREYIVGYRGVILKTVAQPGKSIDVNKSKAVKENEVILIPGTYGVQIHKFAKKFAHSIEDQEETLESVINKMLDLKRSEQTDIYMEQFYEYVLHRYGEDIKNNERLKQKIYDITFQWMQRNGKRIQDLLDVDVGSTGSLEYRFYGYRNVYINFNSSLFSLYEQGFLPKNKIPLVRKYADLIVDAYIKTLAEHSGEEYNYRFGRLQYLKKYTSKPGEIEKLLRKQVGELYNRLNSKEFVDRINSIKDPRERAEAVRKFSDNIKRVIEQLT